ncbi:hypothetical protein D3C73_1277280 [compost metagenome]
MFAPGGYRVPAVYTVHLEYSFPHRGYPLLLRKTGIHLIRPGFCRRLDQRPADFVVAGIVLVLFAGNGCSFYCSGYLGGINAPEQFRIRYLNM